MKQGIAHVRTGFAAVALALAIDVASAQLSPQEA